LRKLIFKGVNMEKEYEVTPYRVRFYCDKCDKEVKFNGYVGMTHPPQYLHNCDCGKSYFLSKQYPTIIYK